MYIEKLVIRNFRCFEKTEIDLVYPGRRGSKNHPQPERIKNVNLFLGNNGSGKTSVFRATALGILAPVIRTSGFQADFLVRRDADEELQSNGSGQKPARSTAEVRTHLQLDAADDVTIGRATGNCVVSRALIERIGDVEDVTYGDVDIPAWQSMFFHDSPGFFLAGYGSNRRAERPEGYSESNRSPRYQRVASLFEEHVGLTPFTYAYLILKEQEFIHEATTVINAVLPRDVQLTELLNSQRQPLFKSRGVLQPYSALSDGFRMFIGWVWDLLYQSCRVISSREQRSNLTSLTGVVIVDEIDLFLHPEWQRLVIEQVARAFPNLQFLFSTHSPLVAGTLDAENIFVLDTDHNGAAVVEQYREEIYGQTANQVLTSSYFRLPSTRARGAQAQELAQLAVSSDDSDRSEFLKRMVQSVSESGASTE